jgi:hypothetical protein
VRMISLGGGQASGDGISRTEGALADDQEWDQIMEEIHQDRKRAML